MEYSDFNLEKTVCRKLASSSIVVILKSLVLSMILKISEFYLSFKLNVILNTKCLSYLKLINNK